MTVTEDPTEDLTGINPYKGPNVVQYNGNSEEELLGAMLDIAPGEPAETLLKEVTEEEKKVIAIDNQLTDLHNLLCVMDDTGGMCQEFAMECEKLTPGFLEKTPLGFFTLEPSATRYKASLEEMSHGMMAAIAAGIAAISAVLWKLLKWLFGGKSEKVTPSEVKASAEKREERAQNIETAVKAVVKNVESTSKYRIPDNIKIKRAKKHPTGNDVKGPDNKVEHEEVYCANLNEVLKEIVGHHSVHTEDTTIARLEKVSAYVEDFVKHGPYTTMTSAFVLYSNELIQRMKAGAIAELEKAVVKAEKDLVEVVSRMSEKGHKEIDYSNIAVEFKGAINAFKKNIETITVIKLPGDDSAIRLTEAASKITSMDSQLANNKTDYNYDVAGLVLALNAVVSTTNGIVICTNKANDVGMIVVDFQDKLEKMQTAFQNNQMTEANSIRDIVTLYREAMTLVRDALSTIKSTLVTIEKFTRNLDNVVIPLLHLLDRALNEVNMAYHTAKEELPPEYVSMRATVQNARRLVDARTKAIT